MRQDAFQEAKNLEAQMKQLEEDLEILEAPSYDQTVTISGWFNEYSVEAINPEGRTTVERQIRLYGAMPEQKHYCRLIIDALIKDKKEQLEKLQRQFKLL